LIKKVNITIYERIYWQIISKVMSMRK